MKTTQTQDSFIDQFDYELQRTFQQPTKEELPITICDCCDDEIEEGKNVGTDEDFCINCFLAGGVNRWMSSRGWSGAEILHETDKIKLKYEKIKCQNKQ